MRLIALGCAILVCACAGGDDAVVEDLTQSLTVEEMQWIFHPEEIHGHTGKNNDNCTFPFGATGCSLDVHEDSACWEHRVGHEAQYPGGLYRQEFRRVHCDFIGTCEGPGDAYAIRLCRPGPPGQETPCGETGPSGCAVCVRNPFCYPQG